MAGNFKPQYTPTINDSHNSILGGIALGSASAIYSAGKAIGGAGVDIGLAATRALGSASLGAAKAIGSATIWTGEVAGMSLWNSLNETSGLKNPIMATAKNTGKVLKGLTEYTPSRTVWNEATNKFETQASKMRLTGTGKAVAFGLPLAGGMVKAYNSYIAKHTGNIDTRKTTATPDYNPVQYQTQHPDFAGATGDLVFALHRNR